MRLPATATKGGADAPVRAGPPGPALAWYRGLANILTDVWSLDALSLESNRQPQRHAVDCERDCCSQARHVVGRGAWDDDSTISTSCLRIPVVSRGFARSGPPPCHYLWPCAVPIAYGDR